MFLFQSIKAATEQTLCGDRVSEELLDAADDLYHQRIPQKWSQLGGDSSPPPTWSLAAWFTDLSNRFSHTDRIIVQVNRYPDVVDKNLDIVSKQYPDAVRDRIRDWRALHKKPSGFPFKTLPGNLTGFGSSCGFIFFPGECFDDFVEGHDFSAVGLGGWGLWKISTKLEEGIGGGGGGHQKDFLFSVSVDRSLDGSGNKVSFILYWA